MLIPYDVTVMYKMCLHPMTSHLCPLALLNLDPVCNDVTQWFVYIYTGVNQETKEVMQTKEVCLPSVLTSCGYVCLFIDSALFDVLFTECIV